MKWWPLIIMLFIAFVLRFSLTFFGVHQDILSQASWGQVLYKNGPFGFYNYGSWVYEWPSQPPLVNLLYGYTLNLHDSIRGFFANIGLFIAINRLGASHISWYYDFVKWFGMALYPPTNLYYAQIIIIKFFAIAADILIGFLIYLFLHRQVSKKRSLLITGLFLFLPFSWYLSGNWGQYDQIGALFLILSWLLLHQRFFILAVVSIFISFQIKPTTVLYLPFFIYYFFYQKPSFKNFLSSLLTILFLNLIVVLPFINQSNILNDTYTIYHKTLIGRRNSSIVNHAFNFWSIFFPLGKFIGATSLLFITGQIIILLVNFWAVLILIRQRSLKYLLISSYILTAGIYIFGFGMLDRYFFPAVVLLGLNLAFNPKLLWVWILTCLLFSFNLLLTWGYPITAWDFGQGWYNNPTLVRILSLLQVLLFFIALKIMLGKLKLFA